MAILAVLALVLPAWLVAAAGVALAGAALTDAWTVRHPPGLERRLASVLARGVGSPLEATARPLDGRRVLLRQPAAPGLLVQSATGTGQLHASVLAQRRGRHRLPPLGSASVGPLGLARVHHPAGSAHEVRVYPDVISATRLIARLRRQLAARASGIARGPLGLGTDFELIREYSPDDDFRQLNWRATARTGRPMSNQYRVERDRDVVLLLDAGRLMTASLGDGTVLDAALDAAVLVALAADELGDRCGAIAFDAEIRRYRSPRHRGARPLIEALFDLEARSVDSDFELAFRRVGKARRGIVVVFTDLVDAAAARSLLEAVPMLARRHALIVASALDPVLGGPLEQDPEAAEEVAAALVTLDVLRARAGTVHHLRRQGATVVEAAPSQLPERVLDAVLRLKSRAAL